MNTKKFWFCNLSIALHYHYRSNIIRNMWLLLLLLIIIQLVQTKKNSAKRRAPDLENQESGWGPKVESNSRIQFASNQSKLVPRKLDPGPSSKVSLSIITSKITFGNIMPQPLAKLPIFEAEVCMWKETINLITWHDWLELVVLLLYYLHFICVHLLTWGFALLRATNDDQIFFFLFLCSHMVFNSLSLFMPMSNLI
jgi:hypothetical protein